eukprot:TRINITY_DN19024_c0_g1_i1.p1 TRINITY_DN19024_c0_g1~~TRINITY_DN19024_c0_g1_i1.p1  ORF type:complete len:764 (+),score=144.53 TRINITY_DN19024_c0_g1_i1:48-2294(+)
MRKNTMLVLSTLVAVVLGRPCDKAPLQGTPACDTSKGVAERAGYIVGQLQRDEQMVLFANTAGGVSRLNIDPYQWWSEALHGVGNSPGVTFSAPTPYATSFPQVITSSASFNKTLWHAIGSTISTEARAMSNVGHAGLTFWAPNINLIRDPRWGRGHETPGEDPFATARYAQSFVTGMQEGEDPGHLKVSSCCKHYYAYDLENWGETDRHTFDANITKQDETDSYLPAFFSCVVNGKASGMMCSYNAVNGVPSCANERIMSTISRGKWGFDGYITSDCGAVYDVSVSHGYAPPNETCNDVLTAGMDSDCGTFLNTYLNTSLNEGVATQSAVATALTHLFSVQIRLGIFDPVSTQPYLNYSYATKLDTQEHRQLALEAAQQGLVLLKNGGSFPLSNSTSPTIAVVGPNANATTTMQANYQGQAPYLISPLQGIGNYARTIYSLGCDTNCVDRSGFAEAREAASIADATVLVIGISTEQEAEGRDRSSIALPGAQEDLITEVVSASRGPVMVVVMAGGSVDFSVAKESSKVDSILWVGYPGQSGGQAIADALFGRVNPSGRLPATQYFKSYTTYLPMTDMNMRPDGRYNPGRTYRFLTESSVYRYGDGISYTKFIYSSSMKDSVKLSFDSILQASQAFNENGTYGTTAGSKALADLSFTVTNKGRYTGQDALLLFAVPPSPGSSGRPLKSLVEFIKVPDIAPGGAVDVIFHVYDISLCVADENGLWQPVKGDWKFGIGPDISSPVTITVQ